MIAKDFINYLNPSIPKRTLLFIAAGVWGFASYRVFMVCLSLMKEVKGHLWIFLIGSFAYLIFFRFVFLHVLQKHTKRIICKKLDRVCIFSFFDVKSYLIMAVMVSLGIISTQYFKLPAFIMSTFFVALSFSLFTASLYFVFYGFRYSYAKLKFASKTTSL